MQKYKEKFDYKKIRSISGYAWLFIVINQDEVGARLALSRNYVKHLPMFREYLDLQTHGYKMTYIYQRLADKYKMHHDSVKRVICKMLRTVEV